MIPSTAISEITHVSPFAITQRSSALSTLQGSPNFLILSRTSCLMKEREHTTSHPGSLKYVRRVTGFFRDCINFGARTELFTAERPWRFPLFRDSDSGASWTSSYVQNGPRLAAGPEPASRIRPGRRYFGRKWSSGTLSESSHLGNRSSPTLPLLLYGLRLRHRSSQRVEILHRLWPVLEHAMRLHPRVQVLDHALH